MDAKRDSAHWDGMKAIYLHAAGALALTFGVAACAPTIVPPVATPAPAPVIRPTAVTPPPVVTPPAYDNWIDAPQTPGTWTYQVSAAGPLAVFAGTGSAAPGGASANSRGDFILTCDRAASRIGFWRAGASAGPRAMIVRTETAARTLQAVPADAANPYLTVAISARDLLLDAMALSKGRFSVEVEGQQALYLPAWTEVSRVIEDCR